MENLNNQPKFHSSWERILHMLVLGAAYTIAETILIGC